MAQIDDFKANLLGGGFRPNSFRVTITPPAGIATGLDVRRTSFLCKATTIPEITLGDITLDRDETVLKTFIFKNAWPKTVKLTDALDASVESTIATMDVTWQYQNYSVSGVNF